jgi:hypothetical protein
MGNFFLEFYPGIATLRTNIYKQDLMVQVLVLRKRRNGPITSQEVNARQLFQTEL